MSIANKPEYWIQPQHFLPSKLAQYRAKMQQHPAGMVYIDDFLKPEIAQSLSHFLTKEVEFKKFYSIKSVSKIGDPGAPEQRVSQQVYANTPAKRQFVSLGQFNRANFTLKPNMPRTDAAIKFFLLLKAWEQNPFLNFWSGVTGLNHSRGGFRFCQLMQEGDVIHKHEDHANAYDIFSTLFLSPWKEKYGGVFHTTSVETGEEFTIVPRYNSLLLFDLRQQGGHWVSPIQTHPENIGRSSIHAGLTCAD